MTKLTDKQELFCRGYLVDLNATQAAIRAGYSQQDIVKRRRHNYLTNYFKKLQFKTISNNLNNSAMNVTK